MIVGDRAPALDYGRAGLWHTTTIGGKTVVTFKSDLHPSTDGINLPMRALWAQLIAQAKPELVITTGTAGAVRADTLLGDVIVSRDVKWDCTKTFADAAFAHEAYHGTLAFRVDEFDEAARDLIPVNAAHLPAATRAPYVWHDTKEHPAAAITTDFFAFDDDPGLLRPTRLRLEGSGGGDGRRRPRPGPQHHDRPAALGLRPQRQRPPDERRRHHHREDAGRSDL